MVRKSKAHAPEGLVRPSKDDQGNAARLAHQSSVESRIADLILEAPTEVVASLGNLIIKILAQQFPANLSKTDKQLVLSNYPQATDALIAERAMSIEGLMYVTALTGQINIIALDYTPTSNTKDFVKIDESVGANVGPQISAALDKVFADGLQQGMSPFGVGTLMILTGVILSIRSGVAWPAIAKTLVESIDHSVQFGTKASPPRPEDVDAALESAIPMIMSQMGISRAAAKRYAAAAKKLFG